MRPPRRRKLLLVLAWSVVGVMLLTAAMDLWHIKYYRPRADRWDLNAYALQQSRQEVDVLFLGSSRFREGISATAVADVIREAGLDWTRTYNVAQPSASLVLNQIMLRDLIASNGCPRLIVLEVSPGALNHNGPWWPALADYSEPLDVLRLAPTVQSFKQLNFLLASPLRGGIRLYDRLATPPNPDRVASRLAARGSKFRDSSWEGREGYQGPDRQRIRWARDLYRRRIWRNLDIGGAPAKALETIPGLAERCQSDLVLVRMPTLIWIEPRDKKAIDDKFRAFISEFAASRDLPFFDAEDALDKPANAHFRDPVHLGRLGALLFSRRLTQEVLLPILEQDG